MEATRYPTTSYFKRPTGHKGVLMAFERQKSTGNRNQFVASIVSRKTGNHIAFVNPSDTFSRQVLGDDIQNVTAAVAMEKLSVLINNDHVELRVTDVTAPIETVDATDY